MVAGAAARILDDLRWLGLDWDEGPDVGGPFGPYVQSGRGAHYQEAIDRLAQAGVTYPCDCSRAEISRIASAPHPGEESIIYAGTCRANPVSSRVVRRPPAVRLAVPEGTIRVDDMVQETRISNVAREVGDFVLQRGDGLFAYQLAVVVDDIAMGVTEVVRGADLMSSTARQVLLARLLGFDAPRYAHAPLVVAPDGSRLAKRARGVVLADHRNAGVDPRRLVARMAQALGLASSSEHTLQPRNLVDRFAWHKVARGPVTIAWEDL